MSFMSICKSGLSFAWLFPWLIVCCLHVCLLFLFASMSVYPSDTVCLTACFLVCLFDFFLFVWLFVYFAIFACKQTLWNILVPTDCKVLQVNVWMSVYFPGLVRVLQACIYSIMFIKQANLNLCGLPVNSPMAVTLYPICSPTWCFIWLITYSWVRPYSLSSFGLHMNSHSNVTSWWITSSSPVYDELLVEKRRKALAHYNYSNYCVIITVMGRWNFCWNL